MHRPTTAIIDLESLAFNLRSLRQFIGAGTKFLAVVKANAYGHGAVECARRLSHEGIDWFGVSLPEEGVELRNAGISEPILVLGGFWPGQEELVIDYRLVPVVFNIEHASLLDRASARKGLVSNYHIKVDTGLGRIGVRCDQINEFAAALRQFPNIHLDGIMSHFAAADDPEEIEFAIAQMERFDRAVAQFREVGFDPAILDMANSAGTFAYPSSRHTMVRLGGLLYGLTDDVLPSDVARPKLKPVLSLKSRITQVKVVQMGETVGYGRTFKAKRTSRIASVPIGYGDGYPRSLSNNGRVIVKNEYSDIVGRISMDWTLIDVTDVPDAQPGTEVLLIGSSGDHLIKAEELGKLDETISYEITCGIGSRVRRIYI